MPPLGFLNPWLYGRAASALNDITLGHSTGCNGRARFDGAPNGSPVIPGAQWAATVGWDAVTGTSLASLSPFHPFALLRVRITTVHPSHAPHRDAPN